MPRSKPHATDTGRRARRAQPPRATAGALGRLEAVFESLDWPDTGAWASLRSRARERASVGPAGRDGADPGEPSCSALRLAAAELLTGAVVELPLSGPEIEALVVRVEDVLADTVPAPAAEVLRAPEMMMLAPPIAMRAQLALLAAFGRLRSVSLWASDTADRVNCIAHAGDGEPGRGARVAAAAVLAGSGHDGPPQSLLVAPVVGRDPHPVAALVAKSHPRMRARAQRVMIESAPLLGAILERDALLTNNAEGERSLVESSERKLVRLGFDLHDGPMQDVAALADDVRLLSSQVERAVEDGQVRTLLRGRLEDVEAQLVAIDSQLRGLAGEVNTASVLLNRSFECALEDRVATFAMRTGIDPRVELRGRSALISTSQQIALLNIIHECLSNIREHAGASAVHVSVSVGTRGVSAEVRDDGSGFDVESTLARSAREGRMGLLAMHERARLLGGRCRISSRPGGPTVVSISLDLWEPRGQSARGRRSGASV
jgi:signal transduction histidine kinase